MSHYFAVSLIHVNIQFSATYARFTAITIHTCIRNVIAAPLDFSHTDRNAHHRAVRVHSTIRQEDHPRRLTIVCSRGGSQQSRNVFKVDCCSVENRTSETFLVHKRLFFFHPAERLCSSPTFSIQSHALVLFTHCTETCFLLTHWTLN